MAVFPAEVVPRSESGERAENASLRAFGLLEEFISSRDRTRTGPPSVRAAAGALGWPVTKAPRPSASAAAGPVGFEHHSQDVHVIERGETDIFPDDLSAFDDEGPVERTVFFATHLLEHRQPGVRA